MKKRRISPEMLELHQRMSDNKRLIEDLKKENNRIRDEVAEHMSGLGITHLVHVVEGVTQTLFHKAPDSVRRTVDTERLKEDGLFEKYVKVTPVPGIVRHMEH